MTLTKNERRALAEFKKRRVDWSKVHGKTLHSLQRKKLVEAGNGEGWHLTAAGLAELTGPDIFADLFKRKTKTKLAWRWDAAHRSWWATAPDGSMLRVLFHKVGGRYSGKRNHRSYWMGRIDGRVVYHGYDPKTLIGGVDKWLTSQLAIAAVEHEITHNRSRYGR